MAHMRTRLGRLALAAVGWVALQPVTMAQKAPPPKGARVLILLGGVPRPREMWAAISTHAGGPQARALVLPWASSDAEGTLAIMRKEIEGIRPPEFLELAAPAPLDEAAKQKVLGQIARANALVFMAGDQNKLLDVAQDPEIKAAITARYEAGVVVAANDAAAISMGGLAVTGEEDPTIVDGEQVGTRPGLALLPRVLVDTQFVRRQRYNRMLGLLLKYPDRLVIGIGSGTALVLRNGCEGEILGGVNPGTAIVIAMKTTQAVTPDKPGRVEMVISRPGNKFDCSVVGSP
jgi:cyanophycinase